MVKKLLTLMVFFVAMGLMQGCLQRGDASSQFKIKAESSKKSAQEKNQSSQTAPDLHLPPVGNLKVTLRSQYEPEVFFAPYLVALEGFPGIMNLIFLPQIEYENFKSNAAFQCHVLVALSQHLWNKNSKFSPYLLDNSQIRLSQVNVEKGTFRMIPSSFSGAVDGNFKSHGMDLISFEGAGKNTTLQGGAALLTKEDLYQVEQRCIRWKNGLPESQR